MFEVRYLGSLQVIASFETSKEAEAFAEKFANPCEVVYPAITDED